jgi:DNA-damage-inducible protein D
MADIAPSGAAGIFDEIKKTTPAGADYWRARDLQGYLGYDRWQNFDEAITRASEACEKSGVASDSQFRETTKLVNVGSDAKREVKDFFLSRYACYLIAMNGDPSKAKVAAAQSYFAVQTRRMEIIDNAVAGESEDDQRLRVREQVREAATALNSAANRVGVTNFGFFHDAGYQGMYGASQKTVKKMKGIKPNEEFLDCVGPLELSANEFRLRLADEKLRQGKVTGQRPAEEAHATVGKKVRKLVVDEIGRPPERLPRAEPIKQIEKRKRKELKGK